MIAILSWICYQIISSEIDFTVANVWASSSCTFQVIHEAPSAILKSESKNNYDEGQCQKSINGSTTDREPEDKEEDRLALRKDYYSLTWISFQH